MAASLLEIGLSNLFVAAVLAVGAAAAGRWGKRPAVTHILWLLVLVKLVTPPVFTVPVRCLPPETAAVSEVPPAPPPVAAPEPAPAPVATTAPPLARFASGAPTVDSAPPPPMKLGEAPTEPAPVAMAMPAAMPAAPEPLFPVADAVPPPEPVAASTQPALPVPTAALPPADFGSRPTAPRTFPWAAALVGVWLGGGAVWLAVVLVRVRRFARVLRLADEPPAEFAREVEQVAAAVGLSAVPRVKLLPAAVAPMVWSFGRTTVFFPRELLTQLTAGQRAAIIAHELAHVRRGDHRVRWLELAALALYWWCPLAWVARRELQRAEEECCDAWVVATLAAGRTYAAALLDTLDFLAQSDPAPAFASGLGPACAVKRRLQLILAGRTPRRLPPAGRVAVAVAALLLLPLAPTLARFIPLPAKIGQEAGETVRKSFGGLAALAEAEAAKGNAGPPPTGEPLLFEARPQPFAGDQLPAWQVAVSPDGKTLATTHGEQQGIGGEVWLWDRASGKVKATIREGGGARSVAFSPDGKTLATGNFDNALRLYDADTGKLWANGYAQHGGHTGGVNGVTFFRSGELIATAGLDKTARVWDFAAAKARRPATGVLAFGPVAVFEGHAQGVLSVAATADGKSLLTSSFDQTARIWDVPATLPKRTDDRVTVRAARKVLRGHSMGVECVAARADGSLFATASWDATVKVWAADGTEKMTLTGLTPGVLGLAFSPDGTLLAAATGRNSDATQPGQVRSWKISSNADFTPLATHATPGGLKSVAWLPDGKTWVACAADRALYLWNPQTKGEVTTLRPATNGVKVDESPILAGAASPDGKLLAFSLEAGGVAVWDAAARKPVRVLAGHGDIVSGLAFSPDGKTVATGSHDKTIKLWDVATGKEIRTLAGHTGWVFAVAFSPDGKTLASGGYDKTVRLWDAASGDVKATFKDHSAGVRSVAFNPGGDRLASGAGDRTVRVWDVAKRELVHTLKGHKGAVRSVAFSPDGKTVASGSEDRTVKLWDAADGKELRSCGTHPDMVTAVRFSPSGRTLAAGTFVNGQTVLWEPDTGRKRQTLSAGGEAITAVLFAADGETLITAGTDRKVRQWKGVPAPDSNPQKAFARGAATAAVALSPAGKLAATGGSDGKVSVWDAATGIRKSEAAAHPGGVTRLEWSANGKLLLSVGADDTAKLWNASSPAPLRTFTGNAGAVSADGKWVAVAAKNEVVLYDAATGGEIRKLTGGHDAGVAHLAFSPDGFWLATAGTDRTVRLWNPGTGKKRQATTPLKYWEDFSGLAFSPDGKRLAVAANGPDEPPVPLDQVDEFRVQRAAWVFTLPEAADEKPWATAWPKPISPGGRVTSVAWSAGGRGLVTTADDGFVRLFDPADGKALASSRAHRAAILAASAQPEAGAILTAGEDRIVHRWPLPGGASNALVVKLPTYPEAGRPVWAAAFSPDGRVLATAGADRTLRLYDPVPAPRANLLTDQAGAFAVAYSPDGKFLVSGHGDSDLVLWDAATGKPVRKLTGLTMRVWGVAVTPDGRRVVTVGGRDPVKGQTAGGEARVWEVEGDRPPRPLEDVTSKLWAVAVSPDGKQIAGACGDSTVRVWDADSGKVVRTIKGHTKAVRAIGFTPDGSSLVSGAYDETVRVWDAATGTERRAIQLPEKLAPTALAVTPDGRAVVVGTRRNAPAPADATDCPVFVFDLGDAAAKPRELKGHAGQVAGLGFLDGGKTLVSGGGRDGAFGEVLVWDFATGQVRATLGGHKLKVMGVAVSPDGKTVATAGGGAKPGELLLWDAAGFNPAGSIANVIAGPYVTDAAFSPDGKTLVLGGWDWSVTVIDVSDPTRPVKRAQVKAHKHGVRSVAFSPDGARFATSDEGGVVKVWDAKSLTEKKSFVAGELPVYRAKFTPDGKSIVTVAGNWKNRTAGEIRVWNPDTGAETGRFPDQSREVWDLAFLDGGKQMVTVQTVAGQPGDASVKVWDTATRKLIRTVSGIDRVRCCAVSADGKRLAVGSQTHPGRVKVWDTATWAESAAVPDLAKSVFRLSLSPDGSRLAVASEEGVAAVVGLSAPPPAPAAKAPAAAAASKE